MAIYIIYKRPVLDFPRVRDYNVGRLICVKEERKMKIHKNNTTHRGVSKRSTYFLLYTAIFLICSACIYVWFARTGRSLISTGDGWKQHFPAFVYFGQYGRTVLRTLLTEHQLVLPQWNFSLGYGGDILTTLHYYVIGDPLDLLSIACPTRYAVYLYSFLSLFRLYLAGLGFGAFCRYKMHGAPLPVAVGSVCYVFFTYSFLLVARHPFFAIPMVYLPLLLLGVEQVLAKRRPYLLIVAVFLAAVSNFYFFYMLAIITAIYTVYRLCCLYGRHSAKQAVGGLLQVTLWAVVGVLMSAAILLPVILTFIGDNRNGVQYPLTLLYDADFYRNFLAAYTTSHNQAYQTYLGFNAVALPAICLLYFKRKPEEKPLRILFLLATAALLIPVFGWALNGFSYMANRWVWAYSLLVAYIVTTQWQKLRHITADKNVAVDGKKIHVYDKGAKVTLHFNGTPNSETYLRMGLRNYTDYPAYTYYKTQENDPLHRYSTDKWNKKDDSQKAYVRRKARSFKVPSSLTLQYTAHTADGAALTPQSTVTCTQTHLRFEGYKVQMVNAGYSKEAKTDITVTFVARGIYDFSTLEVLEQPMTDTDRQVAKLAENTLENIQIGTDTVDGTVTLDRSKILLLTIPYCDGWTATVDGKEAQLLQANTMFSALALEPGEHTIHLTYRTPHLKAGLAVSVLGFAAFGATLLCTEVKKRKEKREKSIVFNSMARGKE